MKYLVAPLSDLGYLFRIHEEGELKRQRTAENALTDGWYVYSGTGPAAPPDDVQPQGSSVEREAPGRQVFLSVTLDLMTEVVPRNTRPGLPVGVVNSQFGTSK